MELKSQGGGGRFRQYSPMTVMLVVVVLLAVALLPSALNIPQSSPNTVPEYAPVPPDEDSQASDEGNLAVLGQARGGPGLTAGIPPPPPLPGSAAASQAAGAWFRLDADLFQMNGPQRTRYSGPKALPAVH